MTKQKKKIYVNNKPINVTVKVYKAYWNEIEKERYQNKLYRKNVNSLDMLFGEQEFNPLELKYLMAQENIKDDNESIKMYEQLVRALFELDHEEVNLIIALFFDDYTEQRLADKLKVNQSTISRRKTKLLEKLQKLIEFD